MKHNIEYSNYINKESLLFGVPWIGIFFVLVLFVIGIILFEIMSSIIGAEKIQHFQKVLLIICSIIFYLLKYVNEKYFDVLFLQKTYLKTKRNRKIKTPQL